MTAARRDRLRFTLRYAAAWSPLALLGFGGRALSGQAISPATGAQIVTLTAFAALLGLPLWTLTGALESQRRWRAAWSYLAAGVGYAAGYAIIGRFIQLLMPIRPGSAPMSRWPQQLLGDFLLYLIALTVMLGARAYARAERNDRAAAAAERAREQAEFLRGRAELQSLRAHLDPHFLFNTLNAIAAVIESDPAVARQMLVRAATLLRRVLDLGESGRDTVTLAEEWGLVSEYLAFERLRMGERLQVHAAFTDDALDCEIPAFTLQPLVENAIRHGLFPRPGAGRLQVCGKIEGESLLIDVQDDGVGAALPSVMSARGFGVRATRERARGVYGPSARVDIETAPGRGFRVRLTIPTRRPAVLPEGIANGHH